MKADPSIMRGIRNPNAVLTPDQVIAMRQAYARGISQGELCRTYGVSITTVQRIVTWKTWTWLTEANAQSPYGSHDLSRPAQVPGQDAQDVEKSAERLRELSRTGNVQGEGGNEQ